MLRLFKPKKNDPLSLLAAQASDYPGVRYQEKIKLDPDKELEIIEWFKEKFSIEPTLAKLNSRLDCIHFLKVLHATTIDKLLMEHALFSSALRMLKATYVQTFSEIDVSRIQESLGSHTILDGIWKDKSNITGDELLEVFIKAAEEAGAHPMGSNLIETPEGKVVVVILAESHAAGHFRVLKRVRTTTELTEICYMEEKTCRRIIEEKKIIEEFDFIKKTKETIQIKKIVQALTSETFYNEKIKPIGKFPGSVKVEVETTYQVSVDGYTCGNRLDSQKLVEGVQARLPSSFYPSAAPVTFKRGMRVDGHFISGIGSLDASGSKVILFNNQLPTIPPPGPVHFIGEYRHTDTSITNNVEKVKDAFVEAFPFLELEFIYEVTVKDGSTIKINDIEFLPQGLSVTIIGMHKYGSFHITCHPWPEVDGYMPVDVFVSNPSGLETIKRGMQNLAELFKSTSYSITPVLRRVDEEKEHSYRSMPGC